MTRVILLQTVYKQGAAGDIVDVRPGFARNYLFPTGLALRATTSNLHELETRRTAIEMAERRRFERAQELAAVHRGVTVPIVMAATSTGILYGSVTPKLIAGEAVRIGLPLSPSDIVMSQPIKTIGQYQITARLHPEVLIQLRIAIGPSRHEIELLGLDGTTLAQRQDRALRLLDSIAGHLAGGDADDLSSELIAIADLADESVGNAAKAAMKTGDGREFEGIVRGALDALNVDCLVGVDATVDLHDNRIIHFRARVLGSLPARVGSLTTVRLVPPEALRHSRLELSLYSPSEMLFSQQSSYILDGSGRLDGIALAQTVTMPAVLGDKEEQHQIWALATLNGECVHRRVWSF